MVRKESFTTCQHRYCAYNTISSIRSRLFGIKNSATFDAKVAEFLVVSHRLFIADTASKKIMLNSLNAEIYSTSYPHAVILHPLQYFRHDFNLRLTYNGLSLPKRNYYLSEIT